jgi:hypothetical protein
MRLATVETQGIDNKTGGVTPEELAENIDQVMDMKDATLMLIDMFND